MYQFIGAILKIIVIFVRPGELNEDNMKYDSNFV